MPTSPRRMRALVQVAGQLRTAHKQHVVVPPACAPVPGTRQCVLEGLILDPGQAEAQHGVGPLNEHLHLHRLKVGHRHQRQLHQALRNASLDLHRHTRAWGSDTPMACIRPTAVAVGPPSELHCDVCEGVPHLEFDACLFTSRHLARARVRLNDAGPAQPAQVNGEVAGDLLTARKVQTAW